MSDDLAIAIQIIGDLVNPDPWEHSREGMDDACHFCGSEAECYVQPPGEPRWVRHHYYIHRDDCPWILAMGWVGRERDGFHLLLNERPEWLVKLTPYAGSYL